MKIDRNDSMRLDGFGLLVEDMGKIIRFYRNVLGFEIKEAEDAMRKNWQGGMKQ